MILYIRKNFYNSVLALPTHQVQVQEPKNAGKKSKLSLCEKLLIHTLIEKMQQVFQKSSLLFLKSPQSLAISVQKIRIASNVTEEAFQIYSTSSILPIKDLKEKLGPVISKINITIIIRKGNIFTIQTKAIPKQRPKCKRLTNEYSLTSLHLSSKTMGGKQPVVVKKSRFEFGEEYFLSAFSVEMTLWVSDAQYPNEVIQNRMTF